MLNSLISQGLKLIGGGLYRCNTSFQITRSLHVTPCLDKRLTPKQDPHLYLKYNDIVYPPQDASEPRLPAEVVHQRANIKYSTKNLMYVSRMIKGMSVDEATKQLSFYMRKGGAIVKEIIEEAQEIAVRDHNVEFKSNMWIESSHVGKAHTIKGLRKHARRSPGIVHYRYTHFFLRLREGKPPKHYYPPPPTGHQKMEDTLNQLRERRIVYGL